MGASLGLTGWARSGRSELYAAAVEAKRKATMGGFPLGYWYLLMVAGKPGPKKDEEIAAVLQPVISVVRVCPFLHLAPLPSIPT